MAKKAAREAAAMNFETLPCSSSQATNDDDPLVQSVLDMFPSMQKSLIKVKNIFFNYEKKIMFTNSV
jgi:hypothetical protein